MSLLSPHRRGSSVIEGAPPHQSSSSPRGPLLPTGAAPLLHAPANQLGQTGPGETFPSPETPRPTRPRCPSWLRAAHKAVGSRIYNCARRPPPIHPGPAASGSSQWGTPAPQPCTTGSRPHKGHQEDVATREEMSRAWPRRAKGAGAQETCTPWWWLGTQHRPPPRLPPAGPGIPPPPDTLQ